MSLRIIKAGLLDTLQDGGRHGYGDLGINPGGAMDRFSAALANALLGNDLDAPVLELHFPASTIMIEKGTPFALCGADFGAQLNGEAIPLHHALLAGDDCLLQFTGLVKGARCYLAVLGGLNGDEWLGSRSTHLRLGIGGHSGRSLQRYDLIPFQRSFSVNKLLHDKAWSTLPWEAHETVDHRYEVECLIGPEWHHLTGEAQLQFAEQWFTVGHLSDRMGYRLNGHPLASHQKEELLSSGVGFGTVQLLPNGSLVVLMADHQTTGGYPRIAQVISAHLPILAQKNAGESVRFKITDLSAAEAKFKRQQQYLHDIQTGCKLKIENLLHVAL